MKLLVRLLLLVGLFNPMACFASAKKVWAAVEQNQWSTVLKLAQKNPELLQSRNENDETVLLIAAGDAPISTFKKMLALKPNLDLSTSSGITALSYAVAEGKLEAADLMLKAGASTQWKDEEGWNLMSMPIREANFKMLDLLFKHQPKLLTDKNGKKTLLDLAKEAQQSQVSLWLKAKGLSGAP